MIREITSIISASPSPLDRLSKSRDADSLGRLFSEIRQTRVQRESNRSTDIALKPNQTTDLDEARSGLPERNQKVQGTSASVQSAANQTLRSDTISFSANAQQLLDRPNSAAATLRNDFKEAGNPTNDYRTSGDNETDTVEAKARNLIAGLRSDFEAPVSSGNLNKVSNRNGVSAEVEAHAASIRSLKNGAANGSSNSGSTRASERVSSPLTTKFGPLAGLRIEKDDSGNFTITKLPNRVEVGGRRFDLSDGAIRLNPDGTIDSAQNSTDTAPSRSDDSEGGLLGLTVRGDSSVKLAPKNGKISATASTEGAIEISGIKVQLDTGTSILVGAAPRGRIEIDESEIKISLGKETFNLRGGQTIRFGGAQKQSASDSEALRQPNAGAALETKGFTPFFKGISA